MHEYTKYTYGTGDVKCATTDLRDIGKFVARIITDPRTLNRYVFCSTEEVTKKEVFALAEKVSGTMFSPETLSDEEVMRRKNETSNLTVSHIAEYNYSLWIRGDNTVENGKKEEYGGGARCKGALPGADEGVEIS